MSVFQASVLKVTSSVIVAHSGAFGWQNILFFKVIQSDVFARIDQRIVN